MGADLSYRRKVLALLAAAGFRTGAKGKATTNPDLPTEIPQSAVCLDVPLSGSPCRVCECVVPDPVIITTTGSLAQRGFFLYVTFFCI